jgi:hypothetical protein
MDKAKTGKNCEYGQLKIFDISMFSTGVTKQDWILKNVFFRDKRVEEVCFYGDDLHENQNGFQLFVRTSSRLLNFIRNQPSS